MVSFLVISGNSERIDAWIKNTISQYKINTFDVTFVEKGEAEKNTIGIEQVRLIQKKLSLRPLQGDTKAVIIKTAELLTLEAQNALLKTLEEPPEDTIIIVATKQTDKLIPTIVSRCRIINLGFETPALSPDETGKYQSLIRSIPEWGIGDRLKQAETVAKDKQEAIIWLEKLIITARGELIDTICSPSNLTIQQFNNTTSQTAKQYHSLIKTLNNTYTILSTTNVNPRLVLENMFLSFNPKV